MSTCVKKPTNVTIKMKRKIEKFNVTLRMINRFYIMKELPLFLGLRKNIITTPMKEIFNS
jgi:hypothetical protein